MLVPFAKPKIISSRRGIAIMMALVILGIILVVAYIYNFTSRQGKLASRRMFWGETVYFLADSVMEEAFHNIKKRPQDIFTKLVDKPDEWLDLDLDFNSIKLDVALGMSLDKSMVKVSARMFPLNKELEFESKGEKVGAIEIVVTISVKKGIGIPLIRQVSARRGFRYVKVFGKELHQDYALLLKKKPNPPPNYSNSLTISRDRGTDLFLGRVFLGTKDEMILGTETLSRADERYLDWSGILLDQQIVFDSADAFDKDFQSDFLLDILSKDPAIKPLRNNQTREDALKWVKEFFRRGAGEDRISMTISSPLYSNHSIPIKLESEPGDSFMIEGQVNRELLHSVTTQYQTLDNDIDQSKNGTFTAKHMAPQAGMFDNPITRLLGYSLFNDKDFIQAGKEGEHLRDFIPYRKLSAYAQIVPNMQSLTWSEVKRHLMIQLDQNTQILNINGIVAVVTDEAIFDKQTIIKGQGALVITGKIIIQNEIKKSGSSDKLVLVSRALGPSLGQGHIHINTDQIIEAYLMCHAFVKNGSKGKISSTNQSFKLKGGMSMDILDFVKLGADSTLNYDPNFAQSDALTLTIGVPMHYYKIYNNEKIDHTSMVDES